MVYGIKFKCMLRYHSCTVVINKAKVNTAMVNKAKVDKNSLEKFVIVIDKCLILVSLLTSNNFTFI